MTTSLTALEEGIRKLLLDREPTFLDDVPRRPQEAYRDLVRGSLVGNVLRAMPLARRLVGEDVVKELVARFLEERGPATRLYRDVPMDFAQWLHAVAEEEPRALPHPAFAELVLWEILEVDVLNAPDPDPRFMDLAHLEKRPRDELAVVFDPSARIAAYRYPVHEMKRGSPWPPRPEAPTLLLAWRAAERLHWHRLSPLLAQVLAHATTGAPLAEAFHALETEEAHSVDRAFCRSWLANFAGRGAILGFAPPRSGGNGDVAAAYEGAS